MTDFKKIKQIMKDSVEKKLVIVDDEDSFVIITLDEYQQLIERSNLVAKIQGKVSGNETESVNQTESGLPAKFSSAVDNSAGANQTTNPAKTTEGEIREVNQQLDNLGDHDDFDSEIRYERLNNGYSEEPV